jgi:hypothetical protein
MHLKIMKKADSKHFNLFSYRSQITVNECKFIQHNSEEIQQRGASTGRERSAPFGKEMRKKLQHMRKPKLYKPSNHN